MNPGDDAVGWACCLVMVVSVLVGLMVIGSQVINYVR